MNTDKININPTDEEVDKLVDVAQNLVDVVTTKRTLKEKLQSRKFWACIALMVVGVCGMVGLNDNTTAIIAFVIMEIVAVGMYVITEGYIDAVHAKELLQAIGSFGKMMTHTDERSAEADQALDEAEQVYKSSEEE